MSTIPTIVTSCMGVILLNLLWGIYVTRVSEGKSLAAGYYAFYIFIVNAYVVKTFVESPAIILPCAVSAFIGTVLAVKIGSKK